MSFLNAVINQVNEEVIREELQQRVDIINHKIKFMDKVPVACLNTENLPDTLLRAIIEAAGGVLQEDPLQAKILIYYEPNTGLMEMMGMVPALLNKEWPAVEYNRVYLLENDALISGGASDLVAGLEDVAEMLYPGYFVFGNEGKTWTSFGI